MTAVMVSTGRISDTPAPVLLTHKFPHFDRNNIDNKRSPYNIERCSMEITNAIFNAQRNVALQIRHKETA